MTSIYIIAHLGLMCFDGVKHEFFDLSCGVVLEEAVVVSYDTCDEELEYTKIIKKSNLEKYKVVDCEKIRRKRYLKKHSSRS